MDANHSIIRLKANAPQIGHQCPVRRVPLEIGDEVVICHRRNDEAVSLRGWAAVQDRCPFCGEIVSPIIITDRRGINLPVWTLAIGSIGLVVIGLIIGRFMFGGGVNDTDKEPTFTPTLTSVKLSPDDTKSPSPTPTSTPTAPPFTSTPTSTPTPTFTPTSTSTKTPTATATPIPAAPPDFYRYSHEVFARIGCIC